MEKSKNFGFLNKQFKMNWSFFHVKSKSNQCKPHSKVHGKFFRVSISVKPINKSWWTQGKVQEKHINFLNSHKTNVKLIARKNRQNNNICVMFLWKFNVSCGYMVMIYYRSVSFSLFCMVSNVNRRPIKQFRLSRFEVNQLF